MKFLFKKIVLINTDNKRLKGYVKMKDIKQYPIIFMKLLAVLLISDKLSEKIARSL